MRFILSQNGEMTGGVTGYSWSQDNTLVQSDPPNGEKIDDDRQPLILIHGWQAKKNPMGYPNRDPEVLAKSADFNNDYDAEGYWWSFFTLFFCH